MTKRAQKWFESQVTTLTEQPGKRWIRGDGGQLSDFVVAKHFLWLYEHRKEYGRPG